MAAVNTQRCSQWGKPRDPERLRNEIKQIKAWGKNSDGLLGSVSAGQPDGGGAASHLTGEFASKQA